MAQIGNSLDGTGYGCELPAMVADWRAAWSAAPGTTDPLAPFGVATLAAGGSEGNGGHMAAMRWAQQANYGHWDSPAMPASFGAQLYDLGDPWHTVGDGNPLQTGVTPPVTKCCATWSGKANATNAACVAKHQKKSCADEYYCANVNPATGKYGPQCVPWNASLWWGTLQAVEPLVRLNAPQGVTAKYFMGSIHPRLKRPVGRRLAVSAVNTIPKYRKMISKLTMVRVTLSSSQLIPRYHSCCLRAHVK